MAYKIRNVNSLSDSWSPTIEGSTGNPTITYADQTGVTTFLGNVLMVRFIISISTISGGSGDVRVTLPEASSASFAGDNLGLPYSGNVNFPASTVYQVVKNVPGNDYATIESIISGSTSSAVQISNLANGDLLVGTLIYWI